MNEIVIREMGTGTEVRRMDVTGKGQRTQERILSGLLINLDQERFYASVEGEDDE